MRLTTQERKTSLADHDRLITRESTKKQVKRITFVRETQALRITSKRMTTMKNKILPTGDAEDYDANRMSTVQNELTESEHQAVDMKKETTKRTQS